MNSNKKENAMETMDIFVPLAYYIGAYRIKIRIRRFVTTIFYILINTKRIEEVKFKIEDDSQRCFTRKCFKQLTKL